MFNQDNDASLVQFLKKMIDKNPLERKKIVELLNDQWLTSDGQNLMVLYKPQEESDNDILSQIEEEEFMNTGAIEELLNSTKQQKSKPKITR
jgi:serine/threonine protein kinase